MAIGTKSARRSRETTLRRLPLASLRVFVIAAEELNFSRAGASLGLSTAAVSMQVRALEDYLCVKLFQRNGRRVSLSPQGESLLPRVRRALEDMESAIEALRAERQAGHLTISMLSSFLQMWMLPRVPDFYARHPSVELRIETSRTLIDFLRSDVQMAIRLGKGKWPNLHADKLFDEWWLVVGAPSLIKKYGDVEHVSDLKRYPLLHSTSEPWESWPNGYAKDMWSRVGSTLDDSAAVVHAAIAGQGLALVRWSLAAGEVAAGRLVLASKTITRFELSYHLVCPEANLQMEKARVFREWMLAQAKAFPAPHEFLKTRRSPMS
jgi:LysR family transcriptional regulator, glycine cleavage system transcriptional activator